MLYISIFILKMYVSVILFGVALCVFINSLLKRKKYPKPPMLKGALPVVGHTLKLLGDHEYISNLMYSIGDESNKNGGVMLLRVALDDYYVITDPEDFTTAANQCLKKHFSYQFLDPWLGDGMISGKDTTIWRRHRKLLNPAFSQHVIDGFVPIFNAMSRQLVENLKEQVGKGLFDHSPYLDEMTLQSICQTAFGISAGETQDFDTSSYMKAAQQMLHITAERLFSFWRHSDVLFGMTPLKREQNSVVGYLNKMSVEFLRAKRKKVSSNEDTHVSGRTFKPFLDLALALSDKGLFSDKEVWEELNTIILAGYETTGNTLMYTMLLLGSHPNVQNKVFEELQEVFGNSDCDVDKQDLRKLVYLDAVIKESLRLYCITPVMLRTAEHDVQLKNYTIPAGSNLLLFSCSLHRHSVWGEDVGEFRPDRWLDPTAVADHTAAIHTAFTGFGVGKRLCLGKNYAMMSMKTTLAHVVRHYRVSSDVTRLRLKVDPLLKPVSGHYVSLETRI